MEKQRERGQVLALIALALLVLVAFVALAVDGGSIYRERRAMQNAADAGALAGAQEICFGVASNAEAKALEYAVDKNGADGAEVTITDLFSVTVVATETFRTYFAGLVGFHEIPIQADATAVCGKAAAGGGLWPIAFDSARWPDDVDLECGEMLILWNSDLTKELTGGRTNCDIYNCCEILTDKGAPLFNICDEGQTVPDIIPLDGRAWVDFSAGISGADPCDSSGCGANELTDRVDGETNQGKTCENSIVIGDCFARDMGVNTSVVHAVERAAGRVVNIPLYDACQSGKEGDTVIGNFLEVYPEDYCPDDAQVCEVSHDPGNSCSTQRFLINKLACLQIGVEINGVWTAYARLSEAYDPEYPTKKLPTVPILVATIPCDEDGTPHEQCASATGWSYGTVPEPGDVRAVNLVD